MADAIKEDEMQRSSSVKRRKKFGKLAKSLKRVQTAHSGGFTPTRGDTEDQVQDILTEQLAAWISRTCTIEPALTSDNLFENLRDGIILCQFAQILTGVKPKSKLQSRKKCAKSDLMCHDNIIVFLDMIKEFSIPEVRFDSIQLVEAKNLKAVNNCLLYFSVEIAKRGILQLDDLPEQTKKLYDKWLKKVEKKKRKSMKKPVTPEAILADSPEPQPHIDEVEDPSPWARPGILNAALRKETITLDDLSMDSATDEETDSVTSDADSEAVAGDIDPTDSVDSELPEPNSVARDIDPPPDAADVALSEAKHSSKVKFEKPSEKSKKTKDSKKKKTKKKRRRRTAYGFTAKDELDSKIMEVFDEVAVKAGVADEGENSSGFGGIVIKKLRRPGEFQFGDSKRKTYIRENNGKLFVRIGGGWEELKSWLQRKIDRSTAVGDTAKADRLLAASASFQDERARGKQSGGRKVGHMSTHNLQI